MAADSNKSNTSLLVICSIHKPHIDDVIEAICLMDSQWLEFLLDENTTYTGFPKWVFIKKLEGAFDEFKEKGDSLFKYYPAECKKNKEGIRKFSRQGFRFIGNLSKDYIDVEFETAGDYVNDIIDSLDLQSPGTELFVKRQCYFHFFKIDGWNNDAELPF